MAPPPQCSFCVASSAQLQGGFLFGSTTAGALPPSHATIAACPAGAVLSASGRRRQTGVAADRALASYLARVSPYWRASRFRSGCSRTAIRATRQIEIGGTKYHPLVHAATPVNSGAALCVTALALMHACHFAACIFVAPPNAAAHTNQSAGTPSARVRGGFICTCLHRSPLIIIEIVE